MDLISDYDLICTAYPPKTAGEQTVDKEESSMKPMVLLNPCRELFTAFLTGKSGGEQVDKTISRKDAKAQSTKKNFVPSRLQPLRLGVFA